MTSFVGICRGGPNDAMWLDHYNKIYRVAILPPLRAGTSATPPEYTQVEFGCYHYVLGQWIWHED